MTPVLTECLVTFRATLNAADFLLSPLIQASNSVSPFAGALKPLFLCHTRFWKCIKVLHTIGSLLCLVCARFILPLLTGCSHVWKSSVLWLDLKPVSCLCLSEKRRVLNSQDLFALPVLRRCSGGSRGTLFSLCSLWSIHSCDERDLGLFRRPGMMSAISIFASRSRLDILPNLNLDSGSRLRPARHVALSQTGAAQYYNTICMLKRWPLLFGCVSKCESLCVCVCLCTYRPAQDVSLTGQPLWPLCRRGEATCFQSIID